MDELVESNEVTADDLAARLTRWERLSRLKNYVIFALSVAVVVALSGWWLTARDHSSVNRNGRVANCRSIQFARTLDGFLPFVTPNHTEADRDQAARELDHLGKLLPRYLACLASDEQSLRKITTKPIVATGTTVAKFSSCDAAKAAHAAPLLRTDPGYSTALDRDGDGIACE